jgi:predicted TIM-barrel enzyme
MIEIYPGTARKVVEDKGKSLGEPTGLCHAYVLAYLTGRLGVKQRETFSDQRMEERLCGVMTRTVYDSQMGSGLYRKILFKSELIGYVEEITNQQQVVLVSGGIQEQSGHVIAVLPRCEGYLIVDSLLEEGGKECAEVEEIWDYIRERFRKSGRLKIEAVEVFR